MGACSSEECKSYKDFLKTSALVKALKDKEPTLLDKRLVEEMRTDKNVLVEAEIPLAESGKSALIALADRVLGSNKKALLVLPRATDANRLVDTLASLPITVEFLDEDAPALPADGAATVAPRAEAQILIGSFTACASLELSSKTFQSLFFLGFSAGSSLPGSDEFEQFIQQAQGIQVCWCSESVPLTLNGAVTRHLRVEDFRHINLEKESEVQLIHEFIEVGHELLAKPEALATIIEVEGRPRVAVFCNNPSETDLLEVLLKKRGIRAKKLIGNIPDHAVRETMDQVRNGEVEAVVLTDISGRGFPIEEFDLVVHHAAPEDPEIYLHRLGHPDSSSRLKRSVSLVGSTDLGNFHFLKKVVEFDFQSKSLPSNEEVASARFQSFNQEVKAFSTEDPQVLEYARLIKEEGSQEQSILFLLNQYLKVLPEALSNKKDKRSRRSRDRDFEGGDHEGSRDGRQKNGRDNSWGDSSRRRDGDRDDEQGERRPKPTRKDIRFYVG
ncbi:MAG: DEAD/DEAH box helicase, partial [Bdellovibrionales bacterium]|nr:DEAD/DEAH box helicase [Bdellovibrionales bacterium]